jgi:hypothetical protein
VGQPTAVAYVQSSRNKCACHGKRILVKTIKNRFTKGVVPLKIKVQQCLRAPCRIMTGVLLLGEAMPTLNQTAGSSTNNPSLALIV